MAGTGSARTDRAGATTRRGFRPDAGPVRRAGHPHSGATHTFRIVTDEPREQAHPGDPQCASAGAALRQAQPALRRSSTLPCRSNGHGTADRGFDTQTPAWSGARGIRIRVPYIHFALSRTSSANNRTPAPRSPLRQAQRFGRRSLPYAGTQRSPVAATGMERRTGGSILRSGAALWQAQPALRRSSTLPCRSNGPRTAGRGFDTQIRCSALAGAACPTPELNAPLSQQPAWNSGPGGSMGGRLPQGCGSRASRDGFTASRGSNAPGCCRRHACPRSQALDDARRSVRSQPPAVRLERLTRGVERPGGVSRRTLPLRRAACRCAGTGNRRHLPLS